MKSKENAKHNKRRVKSEGEPLACSEELWKILNKKSYRILCSMHT